MKLRRTASRHPPETIIALIDVVFFLLVFFLLIGRMDATAPFDVTPPFARSGADMPGGGATVSIGADGQLALNGAAMDGAAMLAAVERLLADDSDLLIRINAHKSAALRNVLPLAGQIEALGARDVVLVVTPGAP